MSKKIIILFLIILFFLSLVILNPDKDDFINYVKKLLKQQRTDSEGKLKKFLLDIKDETQLLSLKIKVKRKNYILFSTFDTRWPSNLKFLGFWRLYFLIN